MATVADYVDRLRAVSARLRDPGPALEVVAADTVAVIDDSFEFSRNPDGSAYRPLSASGYRASRGGRTPLVNTGRLRQSINARVERGTLYFGTNTSYARYHQLGTGRIPARRFLPIDASGAAESRGPGGAHWQRARAVVRRYILTGELT